MAEKKKRKQRPRKFKGRRAIQLFFAAATNSYVTGFAAGKIYQGNLKMVCVPGLNCYSCPGALMSCPIGSLQAVIGSRAFSFSCYVFGIILVFGAFLGRMVCGFLCPFGLIQELLYKIPFPIKRNRFRADRTLRYFKYAVLVVLVFLLPMLLNNEAGEASPAFCKLVCPAGTLEAGIPLVLFNPKSGPSQSAGASVPVLPAPFSVVAASPLDFSAQSVSGLGGGYQTGLLFFWKLSILLIVILTSLMNYRPFCKYLCPLGAMYGMMNPVALYRLRFDESRCIRCGACARACLMLLDPSRKANQPECVRCGDCVNACPTDALSLGFGAQRRRPSVHPKPRSKAAALSIGGKDPV